MPKPPDAKGRTDRHVITIEVNTQQDYDRHKRLTWLVRKVDDATFLTRFLAWEQAMYTRYQDVAAKKGIAIPRDRMARPPAEDVRAALLDPSRTFREE